VEEFSDQEKDELYSMIGMGALKYFLLKVEPKKRLLFDPNESIDFQGHTGPFIQYTHARIRSVLRKAEYVKPGKPESITSLVPSEQELVIALNNYPQALEASAKDHSPAQLSAYLYELAKLYNKFYHEAPILKAGHEVKQFRLKLSFVTAQVIKKGMLILGIEVPEKM
jgi:arginyl-tRNA synthetase